jgi:hypothetical protein
MDFVSNKHNGRSDDLMEKSGWYRADVHSIPPMGISGFSLAK